MKFRDVMSEEFDMKTMNSQIAALVSGLGNLQKKFSENPDLSKLYGNDIQNLIAGTGNISNSFKSFEQQELAKKQQEEKQKALRLAALKNNANNQSSTNATNATPASTSANGNPVTPDATYGRV